MTMLWLDTETYSPVDLKTGGTHAYFNHPDAKIIMFQYAIDDGEVNVWSLDLAKEPQWPDDLVERLVDDDTTIVIHNSSFDRVGINVLAKREGLSIEIKPQRIVDTMVMAYAHCFPGGLDPLCNALQVPIGLAKMKDANALIRLFCAPHKLGFRNTAVMHPEKWEQFCEYGRLDVAAMRECYKRLPKFNFNKGSIEHILWCYDQELYDRGIPVDVPFSQAAAAEAMRCREYLSKEINNDTGGEVIATSQTAALLQYINSLGVPMANLQSTTVERYLENPDIPEAVKLLLVNRAEHAQNTVAKYSVINRRHVNGRLSGTLQYMGASRTGRDAGRVFQPQNLKRPSYKSMFVNSPDDNKETEQAVEQLVAITKKGCMLEIYHKPIEALGDAIRGVIKAEEGHKLIAADLSNIEGRVLVYLSGEQWKLDYFTDFDAGKIAYDNYVMAYAKAFNVGPSTVAKAQRSIGKVMELALGYAGGVSAFLNFVNIYKMDLAKLTISVQETLEGADQLLFSDAMTKYDWAKDNGYHAGLPREQYAACEFLKTKWRQGHPKTVVFWAALEEGFKNAVMHEGEVFSVGEHIKFARQGDYLRMRLPSGRSILYYAPEVTPGGITFLGVDGFTKKWQRISTYSGKLAENATSATARDFMFHHIPAIEKAGYSLVMRVHDELVAHVPDLPEYSAEGLARLMTTELSWAKGLPVAADGFEAIRYRK